MSLSLPPSSSPDVARRVIRGGSLPHTKYGVNLSTVPETYIEPFTAYRAWNWRNGGVTSLNGALWKPKEAFEATCPRTEDVRSMQSACSSEASKKFWEKQAHHVPDRDCTCGMYAGINMKHLLDTNYIRRGIHGEVSLWGRLYRHTLGWRAQYAYPKCFVIPAFVIPAKVEEAQKRIAKLTEYDVDVYIQPEREARIGQQQIPLWVRDYGYSQQGVSFLIERWRTWNSTKIVHTLKVGDRVAVFSEVNGGGIGIVTEIDGDEVQYTLFNANIVCHKPMKEIAWNERNWRWETTGLGMMRKLERETTPRSVQQ